jgi:hypothetical protein
MAGRVKADCGADSMEHSYALTHLIPIGLWVMVIGWHLGSARVHLRRVGEKEFLITHYPQPSSHGTKQEHRLFLRV